MIHPPCLVPSYNKLYFLSPYEYLMSVVAKVHCLLHPIFGQSISDIYMYISVIVLSPSILYL